MDKYEINFDNLTRFKIVETDKKSTVIIAQYSNNSIITLERDKNTNVITEIRSPLLKNFFKVLQWLKATENLSDYNVYINRVNKQYY